MKKGVVFKSRRELFCFRILFEESTFNLLLKSWCTRTGSFGFTLLFACYIDLQWNPTLVARLFKGNPHLRDNTLWSRIFSGFSNVKKPLYKEPLFKGYSDLRDKFLKISLISREILGNLIDFRKKLYFKTIFWKKICCKMMKYFLCHEYPAINLIIHR